MRLEVIRRGFALVPATDGAREAMAKMPAGETYTFEFRKQRNSRFHRKFFALLQVVAEYSEVYDTVDKALVAVKILNGHCDFHPNPATGELVAVPKSISFAQMDEIEFSAFYDAAINSVLKHLIPTMDRRSIEQAVNEVIAFA